MNETISDIKADKDELQEEIEVILFRIALHQSLTIGSLGEGWYDFWSRNGRLFPDIRGEQLVLILE